MSILTPTEAEARPQEHFIVAGGGINAKDLEAFFFEARKLEQRLASFRRPYRGEVSHKGKEGPGQKVTLEVWLKGNHHLVATSTEEEKGKAYHEVCARMLKQVQTLHDKQCTHRDEPLPTAAAALEERLALHEGSVL